MGCADPSDRENACEGDKNKREVSAEADAWTERFHQAPCGEITRWTWTTTARAAKRPSKRAVAYATVALDADVANLDKIKHIVVLMMENRLFDQTLGT